jgi:PAS domain S-box-containing protein
MADSSEDSGIRLREVEEHFGQLVASVRDYAIFLLSPSGIIRSWNAGAERIKGYQAHEIIGQSFTRFYTEEALARGWPQHELKVAGETGRFEDEGWRVRKDGSQFWANVIITALREDDGEVRGFLKITRDLTERRATEEQMRQSEERLRLLIEGVQDYALFMLDPEGRVTSWNVGAERLKGYTAGEIIGQHISTFYTSEDVASGKPARNLEIALHEGRVEDEGWRTRKDRSLFWANVIITPLYDKVGQHRGFAKITRDMTERQRVAELEIADRQKNNFLATLAHELRNPLAPIRSGLELLKMPGIDKATVDETRTMMERQLLHLVQLVDDLMDVSRIVTGKTELRRQLIDVSSIIQAASEEVQPVLDARGHELMVTMPQKTIVVEGDLVRLSQVLSNLLSNAAKYSPKPSRIWLMAERNNGEAVLRVRDEGIGIDAELLPNIFNLFVQADSSLAHTEGGLGIGLTLSKRLVELHGGTITAASDGLGKGSEFVVRVPISDQAAAAPTRPAVQGTLPPPQLTRRILVVDDNVDAAFTVATLLKAWGHSVQMAHNGPAAIEAARHFRPEIVLLDIGLPGMSGYEVAQHLRDDPMHEGVLITALTGYGQAEDKARSRAAGFNYHLTKPPDMGVLEALVTSPQTFLA